MNRFNKNRTILFSVYKIPSKPTKMLSQRMFYWKKNQWRTLKIISLLNSFSDTVRDILCSHLMLLQEWNIIDTFTTKEEESLDLIRLLVKYLLGGTFHLVSSPGLGEGGILVKIGTLHLLGFILSKQVS